MNSDIPQALRSLKHFLAIRDVEADVLKTLIDFSIRRKNEFKQGKFKPMLQGKVLAMIFQKASLRTRLGFETAMVQLGGHAVNLDDQQVGITKREDVRDVARVISSMCDGIMARVYAHQLVVELSAFSSVPVVNGLSDWAHPCQALADLMTIKERFGELHGRKLAYIGDANNVARWLLNGCLKTGMRFVIAAPEGYRLDRGQVESAQMMAGKSGASFAETNQPAEAVKDADVVYTDVWTSMGQEAESEQRAKDFTGFQINAELMRMAHPTAVVMHCLPAHRGDEITSDVLDSSQSIVFQQAENRLHSQRALLEVLFANTADGKK